MNYKEWFQKFGTYKVNGNPDHDLRLPFTIEDLFQAFKARMEAEAEEERKKWAIHPVSYTVKQESDE